MVDFTESGDQSVCLVLFFERWRILHTACVGSKEFLQKMNIRFELQMIQCERSPGFGDFPGLRIVFHAPGDLIEEVA